VVYKKANKLAYSGLYVMVVWILFYELDQLVIGKFIGANKVAIYAVAFTFATFFRTIYGILFSPFVVRANHFAGNKDDNGLKGFCLQLFSLSAPLVVFPTIAFSIVAQPFILTWVGSDYLESIGLARLFSLVFTFSFISYSASTILIAKTKIKEMYIIGTIQPIIYWVGILCTYSLWGLLAFGIFKFIATIVSEAYYLYVVIKIFDLSLKELFQRIFYPILIPLIFLVSTLLIVINYLPFEKSKMNLFLVLGTIGLSIVISFIIQYFTSSNIRIVVKSLLVSIIAKEE